MPSKNQKSSAECQERKRKIVMNEFKSGSLKTHGEKVTNPKQAVAIAYSEAKSHCK